MEFSLKTGRKKLLAFTVAAAMLFTLFTVGNASGITSRADTPGGVKYEAENAALSGGAAVNTNHTGYSGTGFVDGFGSQGATAAFTVNVSAAGQYEVALCYANSSGTTETLSIYVNGASVKRTTLANQPDWNTWTQKTELLSLNQGSNTITYQYDSSASGNVNLDYIMVNPSQNLALNKAVTVNGTNQSYAAANATDGDNSTYWEGTANAYPNTITVDLGGAATVNKISVKLNANWSTSRTQTFSVQTSTDNASYTTAVDSAAYTFNPSSGNYVEASFTSVTARYVRLNFTGNTGAQSGQVAEFGVYGTFAAPTSPDLTVQGVSWSPANITSGNAVAFTATIANSGAATPSGKTIGVDFYVDGTKLNISGSTTNVVAAGGTANVASSGTWTATAGSHTVYAVVDPANTVAESNENNNQGAASTFTVSSASTESLLSSGAAMSENANTQNFVAANANDGNTGTYWEGAANAYPNTLTMDFGSVKNANEVVLELNPAAIWSTRTQTFSILTSTDGTNYTTAVASAGYTFNPSTGNSVQINFVAINARYVRISFTANTGSTGGQVAEMLVYGPTNVNQQPDLTVQSVSLSPASPAAGSAVTFSAVVTNAGTAATPSGKTIGVDFYLDGVNVNLSGSTTSVIGSGASLTVNSSGTWSATTGTHTLYAVVDPSNAITESNENNNQSPGNSFTVGAVSGNDLIGKLYAGYQGWFNCAGDGSPNNSWVHWTKDGNAPTPNSNVNVELYPDLTDYTKLYQTNLGSLGNGQPAKLFSSFDASTVNLHFQWMQQYGIDGAALQRFGAEATSNLSNWDLNRDDVALNVKSAAQTYGRKFYVMYDITGMNSGTWVNDLEYDWTNDVVNRLGLTSSSAYAHQNGKPVVCIWGIGFTDRPGTASQAQSVINWFKNQGCYVIGGVPTYWRQGINDSQSGFLSVYDSFDMLSPWLVGRFGTLNDVDNFKTNVWQPDLTYCQQNGIDYQPVIWPGYSAYNLNGGAKNQIPRQHGDFMWRQAYDFKSIGVTSEYVAMFDEFDEGTAIAKCAENSSELPNNQYFLALNADGTAVSSDFYLRLTGDINKLFKGQISLTTNEPTPFF